MEPYKQYLPNNPFPVLADIIIKVNQMKELTPEEEFVYLINVEEFSPDQAMEFIKNKHTDPEKNTERS